MSPPSPPPPLLPPPPPLLPLPTSLPSPPCSSRRLACLQLVRKIEVNQHSKVSPRLGPLPWECTAWLVCTPCGFAAGPLTHPGRCVCLLLGCWSPLGRQREPGARPGLTPPPPLSLLPTPVHLHLLRQGQREARVGGHLELQVVQQDAGRRRLRAGVSAPTPLHPHPRLTVRHQRCLLALCAPTVASTLLCYPR